MAVEIRIDREKCMGSGNCSFWAPGTFDLDDEGIATVVDPEGDTAQNRLVGHGRHEGHRFEHQSTVRTRQRHTGIARGIG